MALNDSTPRGSAPSDSAQAEPQQWEHILACGTELEDLWSRLDADTLTEHERTCEHCQAALTGLGALSEATTALAAADRAERPEPRLFDAIMTAVRTEVRRGRRIPLPGSDWGSVEVYEQAVAGVLREAVDASGSAIARSCRVRYDTAAAEPDHEDGVVDLELSVTTRQSVPLPELLRRVRDLVRAAALADVGVAVRQVDIVVEDLYPDQPSEQ